MPFCRATEAWGEARVAMAESQGLLRFQEAGGTPLGFASKEFLDHVDLTSKNGDLTSNNDGSN